MEICQTSSVTSAGCVNFNLSRGGEEEALGPDQHIPPRFTQHAAETPRFIHPAIIKLLGVISSRHVIGKRRRLPADPSSCTMGEVNRATNIGYSHTTCNVTFKKKTTKNNNLSENRGAPSEWHIRFSSF